MGHNNDLNLNSSTAEATVLLRTAADVHIITEFQATKSGTALPTVELQLLAPDFSVSNTMRCMVVTGGAGTVVANCTVGKLAPAGGLVHLAMRFTGPKNTALKRTEFHVAA